MARLFMTRGDFEAFQRDGLIRIAYGFKQDLSKFQDRESLCEAIIAAGNDNRRNAGAAAGQMFRFAKLMAIGNRVLTYDKKRRVYLVGEIASDYEFDPKQSPTAVGNHVRKVKWIGEVSRDALSPAARNSLGSLQTVFEPDDSVFDEIDAALRSDKPATPTTRPPKNGTAAVVPVVAHEADDLDLIRRDVDNRAQELIKDKINALDWEDMQDLVAAILRAMGYKTRVSDRGSDRGRDILASPDGLGLSPPRIKVEVKHRQNAMGAPDLRSFIGGLRGDDRGLYVSTGGFTREAQYEAERSTIHLALLDLDDLAELLVQHYDAIDADGRALVPLKRVFFPA
jgi:restriction system protein